MHNKDAIELVSELLGDEGIISKISELIYSRSQMTEGDCDDLAWDIAGLISDRLARAEGMLP